jgi:hypothetical protein
VIEEQGVVFVGLKEIYEKVVQLGVKVDVLLSQHTDAINDIKDHETRLRGVEQFSETVKDVTDHESRLRTLERARWPLPSLAAVVSVAALVLSFMAFRVS